MVRAILVGLVACALAASVKALDIPEAATNRGGYYEYREYQAEVTKKGFREETKARLVILNDRGARFAALAITGDSYNKIGDVRIDVYNSGGEKVYTKKLKDMLRTCGFGPSYALYTSTCTYYIDLPGPAYPYTIEYAYTIESSSLFFLRGGQFQSYLPVMRASYELKHPTEVLIHHRMRGLDVEPLITDGNPVVLKWDAAEIPPLPNDDYLPASTEEPARVDLSPHAFKFDASEYNGFSWKAVGEWYRSLAADRYLPMSSQMEAEKGLNAVREAYSRVVGKNRYVAVSIGIGGWQPHAAGETERVGYGDCKDLTTLLISYLRQNGIEAYPALISTEGSGTINPDFPSFDFNHVITLAVAGNDTVWMDPTCDICACGQLPLSDQDLPVLVVTDTGGVLMRTPGSTASDNSWVRRTTLRLGKDHRLGIEANWEIRGAPALRLRTMFQDTDVDARLRRLERYFASEMGPVKLTEASIVALPTDSTGLVVKLAGSTDRPVDCLKGACYVNAAVYRDPVDPSVLHPASRRYSVNLGYPRLIRDEVTVSWKGAAAAVEVVPPADSLECAHGYWRRDIDQGAEELKITMNSECREKEIDLDRLSSFAEFARARQAKAREAVKLRLAE